VAVTEKLVQVGGGREERGFGFAVVAERGQAVKDGIV
jgi:hypothetical protein